MIKIIFFGLISILCSSFADQIINGLIPMLNSQFNSGKRVTIVHYPYQVSLRYLMVYRCSGSIIKKNVVLTAAHCVYGLKNVESILVYAGIFNRFQRGDIEIVKRRIIHEHFDKISRDYDIALLTIENDFIFSTLIQPIALQNYKREIPINAYLFVSRYGKKGVILKANQVAIVPMKTCSKNLWFTKTVTENMFCAEPFDPKHDICEGQSGSPLVAYNELLNTTNLVGIGSWGSYGCYEQTVVYTKISQLRNWFWLEDKYTE